MFTWYHKRLENAPLPARVCNAGSGGAVTCVTKSMAVIERHGGDLLVYLRRRSREATFVWRLLDRWSPVASKRQ
jgi:hypothetical protein